MKPKLTIITTVFNGEPFVDRYLQRLAKLDREKFRLIVVDAGSSDKTHDMLLNSSMEFDCLISESDDGFYFGLNKAVKKVSTDYYMVLGIDDALYPESLDEIYSQIKDGPDIVLGSVMLTPKGKIKQARRTDILPIGWGRTISHHSVGSVFKTALHKNFGLYNIKFPLLADGDFITKVVSDPNSKVAISPVVFGEFELGGMSSGNKLRAASETFMVMTDNGFNVFTQLLFFVLRVCTAKLR